MWAPAGLATQVGQERAEAVDDTPEVHAEHPGPVGQLQLDDVAAATDPGVVAEQIDAAEAFEHGIGQRLHRGGIADIGRHGDDPELGGGDVERLALDVGDHDLHALAREAGGHGPADPARTPRDDGDPSS